MTKAIPKTTSSGHKPNSKARGKRRIDADKNQSKKLSKGQQQLDPEMLLAEVLKLKTENMTAKYQLTELHKQVETLQAELTRVLPSHTTVMTLQSRVQALEASNSWRVTAPLRWGMEFIRAMKERAALIFNGHIASPNKTTAPTQTLPMQHFAETDALNAWNGLLSANTQKG